MILLISITAVSAQEPVTKSVVKIYTVSDTFSYDNPWQRTGQSKGTGSGCIINGERILTNAHVISNSTFLQVKKAGEAEKYIARIISVSHESDLAILTVDDPGFFKNSTASMYLFSLIRRAFFSSGYDEKNMGRIRDSKKLFFTYSAGRDRITIILRAPSL